MAAHGWMLSTLTLLKPSILCHTNYSWQKPSAMGVKDDLYYWLKSFILDRKEVAMVLGYHSSPYEMTSGVLQGSVRGILLFVAYINDIDTNLRNVTVLKYADDIKLYLEIKRTDRMRYRSYLQSDPDTMLQWVSDWQLKLAVDKCVTMHFRRKNPAFTYFLSNTNLKKSSSERDLSIIYYEAICVGLTASLRLSRRLRVS
ncbi:uncharacterized protein LOC106870015 [Octopus bimaculoides]|uniref:uncharacterized protein LOC106870015 n=1 Tax=Octopus bimaculoides TaxID=37653 RepID=UPI00071CC56A|nr:uncharacterized protein LOC106870015 [Octopus bimaculoides]|eukprot:XP_014771465.1 PREDICTED: uncharacterized protein LOC106870015 [Octopus bimaculoides]